MWRNVTGTSSIAIIGIPQGSMPSPLLFSVYKTMSLTPRIDNFPELNHKSMTISEVIAMFYMIYLKTQT